MSLVADIEMKMKKETPAAPDSTTIDRQVFIEGEDVLSHGDDGLFYFGTVVQVDIVNEKCLIQFGDDTERWSQFRDLKKVQIKEESEIPCILCKSIKSSPKDEILLCHYCRRGYHQTCHEPNISKESTSGETHWMCTRCSEKRQAHEKDKLANSKHLNEAGNNNYNKLCGPCTTLPYNIKLLKWDPDHHINSDNMYCYCGEDGDWYKQMLQCCQCIQWFHQQCITNLPHPILPGDRFYLFLCSVCNNGDKEKLMRLSQELTMEDIAHLALYSLTLETGKKYHDLDKSILPFLEKRWKDFEPSDKILPMTPSSLRKKVVSIFWQNKNRFMCGRELKKKQTMWGLRNRLPPPLPTALTPLTIRTLQTWSNSNAVSLTPWNNGTPSHADMNVQTKSEAGKKRTRSSLVAPEKSAKNLCRRSDPSFNRTLRVRQQQRVSSEESVCEEESSDDFKRGAGKKTRIKDKLSIGEDKTGMNSSISATPIETSSDETYSRGTLDLFIPTPKDFDGLNNPFCNLIGDGGFSKSSLIVVRPLKTKLSEKDIRITKSGEIRRRKFARKLKRSRSSLPSELAHSIFHSDPGFHYSNARNERKCLLPYYNPKSSVLSYFGIEERISRGDKYSVHARRILPKGSTQFLIEWEADTIA